MHSFITSTHQCLVEPTTKQPKNLTSKNLTIAFETIGSLLLGFIDSIVVNQYFSILALEPFYVMASS